MITLALLAGLAWPSGEAAQKEVEAAYASEVQRAIPQAAPEAPQRRSNCAGAPGAGVGRLLFYVLLGLGLGFLLTMLYRAWLDRRREQVPEPSPAAVAPVQLDAAPLADADALAAKGRYTEAVHALLLRTFAALRRHTTLAESLTSREILAAAALKEAPRAALGELVVAVELSVFGGAEATGEDYARCAEAYRRVLEVQ